MRRRTIKVGIDYMLEVELHSHGWEVTVLDRNGNAQDMWIEANIEDRNRRIVDVGGMLALKGFEG